MINLFPLLRDARCLELDILDLLEVDDARTDYKILVRRLAERAGKWADAVEKMDTPTTEMQKNGLRWQLLHGTSGVEFRCVDSERYHVYQNITEDGKFYSRKLLGAGKTLQEAVDNALGFK